MILADKIIDLRKKNGFSQEELAEKMNVSRQSVSKWESAQSVPDLNKIIMLSEIFGVSTDYLLKDSIDSPDLTVREDSGEELRKVSMEEANEFLSENGKNAGRLALGTMICILAVIPMLMLGALSETVDKGFLGGIGIAVMLCIIAPAVGIFIRSGSAMEKFGYLEKEAIDTAYGIDGMVKERKAQFKPAYDRSMTVGVILCIVGAAVMMTAGVLSENIDLPEAMVGAAGVSIMLALIAVGVFLIIKASTVMGGYNRLLEEGDYSREKKQERSSGLDLVGIYWIVLTAAFLAVSFLTKAWNYTWIIFAVGGVLTPVVSAISNALKGRKKQ